MISPVVIAALSPIPEAVSYWSPSTMMAGWSEDGVNITVPISSFPGLTAADADGLTGDARKVVTAFASAAFAWYNNLPTKPGAITVTYDPGRIQTSGSFAGTQKVEFKTAAYLDYPAGTVTDEVG